MVENPQAPVEFEGVALTRSVTIDESFVVNAAKTFYLYTFTRPVYLTVISVMSIGSAVFFAVSFGEDFGYPTAAVIGLVAFPLAFWLVIVVAQRKLRSQLRTQLPIGSVLSSGFTDHSVALRVPTSSAVTEFSTFEKLIERPGLVLLKHRGSPIHQVLPAGLFGQENLEAIRLSIAAR